MYLSKVLLYTFLRWHYPNQVPGRRSHLPLSLSYKLPYDISHLHYTSFHFCLQPQILIAGPAGFSSPPGHTLMPVYAHHQTVHKQCFHHTSVIHIAQSFQQWDQEHLMVARCQCKQLRQRIKHLADI